MAYGHAERNLAAIRQLEADTRKLLHSLAQRDPEQSGRPQEAAAAASEEPAGKAKASAPAGGTR